MYRLGMMLWMVAASALFGLKSAQATPSQDIDFNKGLCESAARHMEQVEGIPAHLLVAISWAETGRWDKQNGENFAWPWTVTALGKGRYYPSKTTAIQAVKQFQAKGIRNIDVGCMQVNLHHHPDAFGSLEQAFDPTINIAYASGFLLKNQAEFKSWTQAAAAYHSRTPKYNRRYKNKIMKLWAAAQQGESTRMAESLTPTADGMEIVQPTPIRALPALDPAMTQDKPRIVAVDTQRTALLNKALKARRAGEAALQKAERRMTQLDAWRSRQFADNGQHVAIMRRAEKLTAERLANAGVTARSEQFEERRQNQLAAWRAGLPPAPNVSPLPDS